jgi:hypothetical protein
MPGAYLWAWDDVNSKYIKVLVDDTGRLLTVASIDELDDIGDVYVPTPTDEYFLYWDAPNARWACRALVDADIPAAIARDTEVTTAISDHAAIAAAHHAKYTDAEAKAAAVLAGAITDAETKAPTHDAVYDVKVIADAAQTEAEVAAAIDADIATHTAIAAAHHTKTVDASELTTGELPTARLSTNIKTLTITFIIDGGGSAITTGQKGHLEIPFACTLTGWTLMADVAGAIVIDIWKDTYANFPPTNADAMPGAGKEPTIAATNQKAQDTNISDWATVAISAGDILAFNVDSCATITRVTLSLKAVKT